MKRHLAFANDDYRIILASVYPTRICVVDRLYNCLAESLRVFQRNSVVYDLLATGANVSPRRPPVLSLDYLQRPIVQCA